MIAYISTGIKIYGHTIFTTQPLAETLVGWDTSKVYSGSVWLEKVYPHNILWEIHLFTGGENTMKLERLVAKLIVYPVLFLYQQDLEPTTLQVYKPAAISFLHSDNQIHLIEVYHKKSSDWHSKILKLNPSKCTSISDFLNLHQCQVNGLAYCCKLFLEWEPSLLVQLHPQQ